MEKRPIAVSRLLLDTENPRHEPVESQRDAIRALIRREGQGLVTLATDIAKRGLSPAESLFIIEDDDSRNYVVIEGNRRLAAIRLLKNPGLADKTDYARAFARIAKNAAVVPTSADCSIFEDREEADPWIVRRHTTGHRGAGVQPWNTVAATRYALRVDGKPHHDAKAALTFLDALQEGFPEEPRLADLVATVADKKLTTLGRLVRDPDLKAKIGMSVDDDGRALFEYPPDALLPTVDKILTDLAGEVGVTQLKTKELRVKYLASVPSPSIDARQDAPSRLGEAAEPEPAAEPSPKPKAKPKPKAAKPAKPLKDLDLSALGGKVEIVLEEFKALNHDKFPYASAVLLRSIVELAADQYRASFTGKEPKLQELGAKLQACLDRLSKSGIDDSRFPGVRTGLQDKTSQLSVGTLHGYVHHAHFHPTLAEIRRMADNFEPFLQALNEGVSP